MSPRRTSACASTAPRSGRRSTSTGVDPTGGPVSLDVTVEAVDPRGSRSSTSSPTPSCSRSTASARSPSRSAPSWARSPSGLDAGAADRRGHDGDRERAAVGRQPRDRGAGADRRRCAPGSTSTSSCRCSRSTRTARCSRPIDVEPAQVRVRVPVFTDRRSKTLPVTPNVVGTPAAGFEVASIEVDPPVVSVEGDANDLAGLDRADTRPISVAGASSQVTQIVGPRPAGWRAGAGQRDRPGDRQAAPGYRHANLRGGPDPRRRRGRISCTPCRPIGAGDDRRLGRRSRPALGRDARAHGRRDRPRSRHALGRRVGEPGHRAHPARREPQSGRGDRLQSGGVAGPSHRAPSPTP